MNQGPNHERNAVELDTGTKLAFERTYLAYERTQMAWVRTSLTLISFGFTIAKFFEFLHEKTEDHLPRMAPRSVGILMISIGLIALALASATSPGYTAAAQGKSRSAAFAGRSDGDVARASRPSGIRGHHGQILKVLQVVGRRFELMNCRRPS